MEEVACVDAAFVPPVGRISAAPARGTTSTRPRDSVPPPATTRRQFHDLKVKRNSSWRNFTLNLNRLFSAFILAVHLFALKF